MRHDGSLTISQHFGFRIQSQLQSVYHNNSLSQTLSSIHIVDGIIGHEEKNGRMSAGGEWAHAANMAGQQAGRAANGRSRNTQRNTTDPYGAEPINNETCNVETETSERSNTHAS